MSDSSAYSLQMDITDLKQLQEQIKSNGTEFDTAVKLCRQIATELEGSNPKLAQGWSSVGDKLQFFSDSIADRVGDLYQFINEQMEGIKDAELKQNETVDSYISQGDQLISELQGVLDQVASSGGASSLASDVSAGSSYSGGGSASLGSLATAFGGLATSLASLAATSLSGLTSALGGLSSTDGLGSFTSALADGVTSLTGGVTSMLAEGVTQLTGQVSSQVADGVTKATGGITSAVAGRIGEKYPEAAGFANAFAEEFTNTTGDVSVALADGITYTTGGVSSALADGITYTTGGVTTALANRIPTSASRLAQEAGSMLAARNASRTTTA
ncbi:MAG: hypothetical protein IKF71_02375 [Bacilli bacterium]|nr:hypothetical protein [Bacilli bacterium]